MKNTIIPEKQYFCKRPGSSSLNLKAICIFAATGFFLEKDTYYNNTEALQPATEYKFDENNYIQSSNQYWHWHYSPRDISLKQATEEFGHLFERVSLSKLRNKKVILPLSGGLDSRTQAAALDDQINVESYSYKFVGGPNETKYGYEISKVKSFPFNEFIIPEGYLWKVIDQLSILNQCYADFTNPRQMAVIDKVIKFGDIFYLGHWGDVLFDDMGIKDNISFTEQVDSILKKILKRGGVELATNLWKMWELEGNFESYFRERISVLLDKINIENANTRIRAFKSIYWAPRWTSANMVVFSNYRPLALPYYDDELCKFICTIPEHLLSGRKIQINYIKMKSPLLAKITWQTYEPCNLYNFKNFGSKKTLPLRALKKGKRIINENIFGNKYTTRNWEIQFLGKENDKNLQKYLFENNSFQELISPKIIKEFYYKFKKEDSVTYSHPLNMLLTLSMFSKNNL